MSGENEVDIDAGALERELHDVEIPAEPAAPAADGQGGEVAAVPAADALEAIQARVPQWQGGAEFLVNGLADGLAPNWAITQDERRALSSSIAMALAAWFPDDTIPVKYLVLLNVGGAAWGIVTARRDANGGKLPPMRLAAPKSTTTSAASAPATTGASGGVTTSA